ncbi:hypothetical protein C1H46_000891 [Malus baccata]|uniref:Uncharacterized protein n=1 Tax=Malus baccata TaxID=106549 RepID=A0A540NSM0_MALBA|nr:hypothetical protein C1H46_000891 [Malus baccata]
MSRLISTRRVASSGSPTPPPPLPSTRCSPTIVDPHMAASGGPDVAQAPASSMFSVALPPSAQCTHRRAWPPDMASTSASTSDTTHLGKITKLKTGKVTRVTSDCITIRYNERHRATSTVEQHSSLAHDMGHVVRTECPMLWKLWHEISTKTKNLVRNYLLKNNLHKHYELFDDPNVALDEGCPLELEDRPDEWAWLCNHFQGPTYVDVGFQILNETLDATLGQRPRKYCLEMRQAHQRATGASSSSQPQGPSVTELTHEMTNLKSKLTLIIEALSSNGIRFPPGVAIPSTSEPNNPSTSKPIHLAQTC